MGLLNKYLCCPFDLNLVGKLIGSVGIIVSLVLTTVLINDNYRDNYNSSRYVARMMGIDWEIFNLKATDDVSGNTSGTDGELESIVVAFHTAMSLIVNVILIYGTICKKRWYVIPWLIFGLYIGILKILALIFQSVDDSHKFTHNFVLISLLYLLIITACSITIFWMQLKWKIRSNALNTSVPLEDQNIWFSSLETRFIRLNSLPDSPLPYRPNMLYSEI